jgi:hypothetical protein
MVAVGGGAAGWERCGGAARLSGMPMPPVG